MCQNNPNTHAGTIAGVKPMNVLIYNNAGFIYSIKLSLNLCSYRLTSHSYQLTTGAAIGLSLYGKNIGCWCSRRGSRGRYLEKVARGSGKLYNEQLHNLHPSSLKSKKRV
jgi:hypothetical protein